MSAIQSAYKALTGTPKNRLQMMASPSKLSRQAEAAAAFLRRAGAGRGQPLAAVIDSAEVLCVLAHAAAALGCPLFPIDPALPDAAIEDLLTQAAADMVVGDRAFPGRNAVSGAEILAAVPASVAPSAHDADDIALMVATSGSSGRPKVVMLSAANLRAAAHASAARTPLGPGDRWLACLPLFHIGGYSILGRCAYAGAEAVVQQGFDPERVWHALATARITHLSLVPAMLSQLLDISAAAPPISLRHVLVGGAALSSELAERAAERAWPIQPTYGMSETASQVATLPALPRPWRQGNVGRPLPGVEVGLDPDGRLRLRGPMVMAGYANPGRISGDGLEDGWFVTSDLAEITAAGELVMLGRIDDVIITAGKKVLPAMVEDALARCPGIDAVGVVGRKDAVWGEVVTAVYSGTPTPAEVLGWCRDHVGGALRPRAAVRVAVLPRLANGKPDRSALRRLAAGDAAEPGAIPQDQLATTQ